VNTNFAKNVEVPNFANVDFDPESSWRPARRLFFGWLPV
jgi:hypothetical protein